MAGRFQLRRGNTAQNDAFTGAEGEVTYDTQNKSLRLHDGVTQGGVPTVFTLDAVMPDYSRETTITSGFVADKNYIGFCCCAYVVSTECWVKVDGVYVYRYLGGSYEKQVSSQWFVPRGSTVTFSSTSWNIAPRLYPLKGN